MAQDRVSKERYLETECLLLVFLRVGKEMWKVVCVGWSNISSGSSVNFEPDATSKQDVDSLC